MTAVSLQRLQASWKPGAMALAPELFSDEEVYQAELRRIFQGPVWFIVGHAAEFPADGDYKTHQIGDVPVIVSRKQDSFHVLVNACAHRGTEVVRGPRGNSDGPAAFTCIYHRWVYDAAGMVTGVGRRQGYPENFPIREFCLPRARVAVVSGVIFASLSPNPPPIEDYLGKTLIDRLDRLYGSAPLVYLGLQRAIFQCNWKLYIENIYDSYHAPTLHKAFALLRLRKPSPQLEDESILKYGHYVSEYEVDPPISSGLANGALFETRSRSSVSAAHLIANIFPTGHLNEQLDVLAFRLIIPRGPAATEIQFHCFGRQTDDDSVREQRLWQTANFIGPQGLINLEDAAALARVQIAMQGRARSLDDLGGRRFPARRADEKAIDTFYAAYRRLLFAEGSPPDAEEAVDRNEVARTPRGK